MRISRTIISVVLIVAALICQLVGIDVALPGADSVGADGWSLMQLLEIVFAIGAAYFRVKATETVSALGVKAGEPLS